MEINREATWQVQSNDDGVLTVTSGDYFCSDQCHRTDFVFIDTKNQTAEHTAITDEGEEITFPWGQIVDDNIARDCLKIIQAVVWSRSDEELNDVLSQNSCEATLLTAATHCLDKRCLDSD